ncbi:MAG: hypothetical protein ACO331_11680 [Prochlorothrix sp.]
MPLFEQPYAFPALVAHYLRLNPINPVTGDPTTEAEATPFLTSALRGLEQSTHVLLTLG